MGRPSCINNEPEACPLNKSGWTILTASHFHYILYNIFGYHICYEWNHYDVPLGTTPYYTRSYSKIGERVSFFHQLFLEFLLTDHFVGDH